MLGAQDCLPACGGTKQVSHGTTARPLPSHKLDVLSSSDRDTRDVVSLAGRTSSFMFSNILQPIFLPWTVECHQNRSFYSIGEVDVWLTCPDEKIYQTRPHIPIGSCLINHGSRDRRRWLSPRQKGPLCPQYSTAHQGRHDGVREAMGDLLETRYARDKSCGI